MHYFAFQLHADSTVQNSTDKYMVFLLQSIKCSAAPPSFGLCCMNCAQQFNLVTAHLAVVGSGRIHQTFD